MPVIFRVQGKSTNGKSKVRVSTFFFFHQGVFLSRQDRFESTWGPQPTRSVLWPALKTKSVHNFLCVGGPDGIKTNLALVPRPFGDGLEDKACVQVARSPLCHGFLSFWRGFDWKKARVGPRQETWLPDPNSDAVHFWWPPLRLKSPSRSF